MHSYLAEIQKLPRTKLAAIVIVGLFKNLPQLQHVLILHLYESKDSVVLLFPRRFKLATRLAARDTTWATAAQEIIKEPHSLTAPEKRAR